ncbi:MAG: DNA polymerase III subunit gamma/tau [Gammaproteobacteria bacterium]|nr:DNA polymerase III subunit gamma/tau [Gammaproteobacteria bacterium]
MSYQVLARKLRPTGFDSLIGQDHIVRALSHALQNDRVHHAYLFTGTRGVGKTTIARILAKCLNCETNGVSATPCQTCSACRDIADGRYIDLIEVDAASRTGVSDTRELLENAQYLPSRGRFKVYLIDEVHMLSTAAFNALLKTLEEPPEHVKFLLATTEAKKVPVTVLSRCLQFQLKNLSVERIAGYLAEVLEGEGIVAHLEALDLIARAAKGSMRDALSLTDQAIGFGQGALSVAAVSDMLGLVGRDQTGVLLEAIAAGSAERVLAITAEFAERAIDFAAALAEVAAALHAIAVSQATGHSGTQHSMAPEAVQLYYQIAIMGMRDLPLAPDPRSGAEMTFLRMLSFSPDPDSRVARSAYEDSSARTTTAHNREAPATSPTHEKSHPLSSDSAAGKNVGQAEGVSAWHEVVERCDASGVTRMLLEHCVSDMGPGDKWELLLDPRHDTLLNESQQLAIQRTLEPFGARTVRVRVTPSEAESPARRKIRLAAEAQSRAEAAVAADPVVQSLLQEFGGRVQRIVPNKKTGGTG